MDTGVFLDVMDKNILIDDTTPEIQTFIQNPYKNSDKSSNKYRSILSKIIMQKKYLKYS